MNHSIAHALPSFRGIARFAVALAVVAATILPAAAGRDDAFLGISSRGLRGSDARDMDLDSRDGAIIEKVYRNTAAADAGLERDDIIVKFGGKKVYDDSDLTDLILSHDPGETVAIGILRDGKAMTLQAQLGSRGDWEEIERDDRPGWVQTLEHIFGGHGHDRGGPYLGVEVMELNRQMAEAFEVGDKRGVMITRVSRKSAAEDAGIRAGDIVVRVAGERTTGHGDIRDSLDGRWGETITVDIVRRGTPMTVEVTLQEE